MLANSSYQLGQTVGARLRAARLAKKYTQNQLASPDFSVSYVSAIERGQIQPSLRALEILAQRLDLSTTDLLPTRAALAGATMFENGVAVGSEEWELQLLEAQVAIYQRKPGRAIEILRPLLPQKGERRQEKDSAVYFVLGRAYLEERRWQESEQVLAEAARLAKEAADPFYPYILSLQSAAYTAMHNTEQAVQLRRESLRVLAHQEEGSGNKFFMAQLHASLAQHYSYLGELEQASEQFQQTLNLLHTEPSCRQLQENYEQLFNDYLARERYTFAILYSLKWSLAEWRCGLAGTRSEIVYALGYVLLRGDQDNAYDYLLSTAREAEARQDHLSLAGANVQLASWQLAHGEVSQAEQLVQLALKLAEPCGETLIKADALLLAGELAYRRENYPAGDHAFEDGLALLEQTGAREELIEHLAHYAQLLEERNCIPKALLFWKRAYEYRQNNRAISF